MKLKEVSWTTEFEGVHVDQISEPLFAEIIQELSEPSDIVVGGDSVLKSTVCAIFMVRIAIAS